MPVVCYVQDGTGKFLRAIVSQLLTVRAMTPLPYRCQRLGRICKLFAFIVLQIFESGFDSRRLHPLSPESSGDSFSFLES